MTESTSCCQWCTGFLFSTGLTALFMWLSLRPSKPNFSIEEFYIPALNISSNSTSNTSISFHLRVANPNKDKRIYYDALNVTLFYGHNLSFPVANKTILPFRQGHKKKVIWKEMVGAVGVPWEDAKKEVKEGTTVFRVDVATAVRYKIIFWKTRHYRINVGGNVTVNDKGEKATKKGKKKGYQLSCAPVSISYCARTGVLVLFVTFLLFL